MNGIKRIFTIEKLQYVCVAQERNTITTNEPFHLHIQIILKEVINKKTWFLDSITRKLVSLHKISKLKRIPFCFCFMIGNHCNYQVTQHDRAWNEYIKKGLP